MKGEADTITTGRVQRDINRGFGFTLRLDCRFRAGAGAAQQLGGPWQAITAAVLYAGITDAHPHTSSSDI